MIRGWSWLTGSGSGGGGNAFGIIQTPAGTSPTATTATDTLTLTSSDSSITITGNSGAKTVNFQVGLVPVASGGWGQSMAKQVVTTTTTFTIASGLIKWTGGSVSNLAGITAATDGVQTIIWNGSSNNLQVLNQSGSAIAANRIITPTGGTIGILPGMKGLFVYDATQSRWVLLDINSTTGVTNPLAISSTGVISMPAAGSSQNGYLVAADWVVFNQKLGVGDVDTEGVLFRTAAYTAESDPNLFSWNQTKNRMGVGLDAASSLAGIHSLSDTATAGPSANSFSVTTTQFTLPTSPTVTITPTTPDIAQVVVTPTTTNLGAGAYNSGDIVDYSVTPGYDDGVNPIVWGVALTQAFGITDPAVPFDISVTLTPGTENFTTNVWSFSRQVNAGGFNDYQRFTSTTFTDTNVSWAGGADTLTPLADDFYANGSSYSLDVYGTKLSPASTVIVAASPGNGAYNDPGNNTSYKMDVALSGGDTDYRVAWFGGRTYIVNASFVSGPIGTSTPGAPTLTPTSYGYLSDGSNLNITYNYYATSVVDGTTVYSATPAVQTITDSNDGNYYYVTLFNFDPVNGKLLRVPSGPTTAILVVSNPTILDDGVTIFGASDIVIPNSVLPAAVMAQADMDAQQGAQIIVKAGGSGVYTKINFIQADDTVSGSIVGNAVGLAVTGAISITFEEIASAAAAYKTLFVNSSTGVLSYKDDSGTVHTLY